MNKQYVPNIKDSYALITGGTQGLGLLYVKELLTIGYDVIVVSPHELKIESLKTQFPNRKIVYLKRDLCSLKQCEITFYECNKFNISLIINNSGIGVWGQSLTTSFEDEMKVVDLNIRALHYFTKKFAQRFCENKSGRIINIASIASFLPGPLFANYYASKAYVLSYSSAFNSELKYMKSPIRIVTICPGFLKTSFFMHSNNIGQSPYLPSVKPEIFAHKSLHRALLTKNKNYILVGTFTKICWFLNLFIPKKLSLKIIYKWQSRRSNNPQY